MNNRRWSRLMIGGLLVSLITPAGGAGLAHAETASDATATTTAAAASETTSQAATSVTTAGAFQDMTGHWAQSAVERMASFKVVSGYGDGSYKPSGSITRAEFIVMLDRIFGFAGQDGQAFRDVAKGTWYYDAIMRASGSGIVNGAGQGYFAPAGFITRQDAAVMIDRAFELSTEADAAAADTLLAPFADRTSVSGYAKNALSYLIGEKAMKGFNGKLLPKGLLTRAESAVLLSGMIGDLITKPADYHATKVTGNLIIRSTDVTVDHTVVEGNLLLAEGIGEGDAALQDVTVAGSTIINGGGSHSIQFDHSELNRVKINKHGGPVHVVFKNGTHAEHVVIQQPASFEQSKDSSVDRLDVDSDGVTVNGQPVASGTHSASDAGSSSAPGSTTAPGAGSTPPPVDTSTGEQAAAATTIPDDKWSLVWNDEFNGSSIDASKWSVVDTGVVYNNELEYYSPNNAVVEKDGNRGVLSLKAKKEDYKGKGYTSAKLITKNKGDWTYGKVVVRAKLPAQQGMWPAIWLMPTDETHYGGWPASGEIDLMEMLGGANNNKAYGTLHYDSVQPDGTHGSDQGSYTLADGAKFADAYHDFQLEWLPGVIRFYIDGHLYQEVKDWKTKGPGQPEYYTYPAPFDRPFYLILNLAVGGDWPGAPNGDFVSEDMDVDFVRVYKYNDLASWPDVTGNPPQPTEQRPAQEDGNLLYDGEFTQAAGADGVPPYWQFLKNASGDGQVSIVDDAEKGKAAKIDIANAGTEIYSIQLTQMPVYLQEGRKYKVTFDAKADANRTLMSKANQFEKSWKVYSGEHTFDLTPEWQSFGYEFDMTSSSDNNARFEFNLGKDATATSIANVKLVDIGEAAPPAAIERTALADGNLIYNGTFDQGKNRLAFWTTATAADAAAQFSVSNFLAFPIMERQLVVNVSDGGASPASVAAVQPDLVLAKNSEYAIYFDAKADAPRTMSVELESDRDVQLIGGNDIALGNAMKTYALNAKIGDGSDIAPAALKLLFGGQSGTVTVDNVRLVKRGAPLTLSGYTHVPADQAWEMQGLQVEKSGESGNDVAYMDEGDTLRYKLTAQQDGEYAVSLRAASGQDDAQIRLNLRDENGNAISADSYELGNTTGWQTYKTVYLKPVQLEAGHSYYLDLEGYGYNTLWLDLSPNRAVNGSFDADTAGWALTEGSGASVRRTEDGQAEVTLNGESQNWWDYTLQQGPFSLANGKSYRLEFDASTTSAKNMQVVVSENGGDFTKYDEHTAALTADKQHYAYEFTMAADSDANALLVFGLGTPADNAGQHAVTLDNIRLFEVNGAAQTGGQPLHVNLLQNGDFANGTKNWLAYSTEEPQLSVAVSNGELAASIGTVGVNEWDRQLIQEGFSIQQGYTYQLTFKARAAQARSIGVGAGWLDAAYNWTGYYGDQAQLSDENQTFTYTFDVTTAGHEPSRISFNLGNFASGNVDGNTVTFSDISLVNLGPIK